LKSSSESENESLRYFYLVNERIKGLTEKEDVEALEKFNTKPEYDVIPVPKEIIFVKSAPMNQECRFGSDKKKKVELEKYPFENCSRKELRMTANNQIESFVETFLKNSNDYHGLISKQDEHSSNDLQNVQSTNARKKPDNLLKPDNGKISSSQVGKLV